MATFSVATTDKNSKQNQTNTKFLRTLPQKCKKDELVHPLQVSDTPLNTRELRWRMRKKEREARENYRKESIASNETTQSPNPNPSSPPPSLQVWTNNNPKPKKFNIIVGAYV